MLLFILVTTGLVLSYPGLSSPPSSPHSANLIQLPCKLSGLSRRLGHWSLEAASQAYSGLQSPVDSSDMMLQPSGKRMGPQRATKSSPASLLPCFPCVPPESAVD